MARLIDDQYPRRHAAYQAYHGPIDELAGAEVAAGVEMGNSAARSILVGVATGVLTLLVNRWLERLLK